MEITLKTNLRGQRPIFVDTSVLIDGRIVAIAASGFMAGTLTIPRSVVGELQLLADNGDTDKRARARHGLDVIKELQALNTIKTVIFPDKVRTKDGVDNRLLNLAERYKGAICTIDFNLNKVAQVEGIQVLNVNELAQSLRMAYLPGEKTRLALTQKGNDSHQAIGHLSDGTMVVVEHASQFIGKTAEIEFIRGLQTAAGKMMFARVVAGQTQQPQEQPKQPRQAAKTQQPRGTKPPRPEQRKEQPAPAEGQSQKPQQPARRPNNRRRRSPEDSLIELANK